MSIQENLDARINALEAAITAEHQQVMTAVDQLKAVIFDLQSQVAPDLQPQFDRLTSLVSEIENIYTEPVVDVPVNGDTVDGAVDDVDEDMDDDF